MATYQAKPAECAATRKWYVLDATDLPLGRLATRVASVLRGKHKAIYTPHVDTGDFVIMVNADKVKLTGVKSTDKMYYSHSGYPGAIKRESFREVAAKDPAFPIEKAVKGMLPKNVLGREMLLKLKVYGSDKHPHTAQKPEALSL
jgi:large subunit ribosomal protein L13